MKLRDSGSAMATIESLPARRRKGGAVIAAILILLPILYVLSIGPVALLVEKTGVGMEAARTFYWPLIWLHDNTPLEGPLAKYIAVPGLSTIVQSSIAM